MNEEEIIIINDKPFYRILNGTSYDYAPIPKEFKPYFERLQQENKQQKEVIDRILSETKETRNILNNNRDDNMLSKSCLLSYLEIVEDLLNEVSE